ncbi:hypothetical protein [Natrarchaeobius oligotrophus]|uniref:Site-specific integrase n=1 Tax=Natrarchaeobius chitinivorans TaxID=1679083 RepID=A0A3N6M296_NATCH|nr:hypothetical protein [Natrarchaeobius chitinivorans]RQG94504.1 hypothetical protein EA472_22310 [Natrarchaeobius chitinivorans]
MVLKETIGVPRERAFHDPAIVIILAVTGVREVEIFRDPNDSVRDGHRWIGVDLEHKRIQTDLQATER